MSDHYRRVNIVTNAMRLIYGGQILSAVVFYRNRKILGGSFINAKTMQINEDIRDAQVRLVGDDGEQLGILSAKEAQKLAIQKGLDLVKIAPQATPPVCKLMDYSKYCFEQAKKAKEQKKSQKTVSVK